MPQDPQFPPKRCDGCLYYQPPDPTLPYYESGTCRLVPPVVVHHTYGSRFSWPTVPPEGWCGQWFRAPVRAG